MTRARGRGRRTGRGRAVTSPVADERRAAFEARKAGLLEKALDLSEVEDVAVAVVCSGVDGLGGADYWPSVEAARAVAELFYAIPEKTRNTAGHASDVEGLRDAQLAEVREGGIAAALGPWERALDGMSAEALRELLASIEVSLKATRSRIRELQQPQPDESVAENSVAAGEESATPASGEVMGKLKRLPGDGDSAWMKRLVMEGLKEKPGRANGNAAPCGTGRIEHINVAGEEDASVEVQARQKQPQGDDEVQRTQKRSPGDDDDDAAWMKQLVEDLKEKPEPASGSAAAPYDAGMIEYINVCGYVMEQDAYDFIRFDLGMFPPSLEPESPDYDEPLRLWSWEWDYSSFPHGAPPPPPPK